ncbi:NAD(P)-dependent dehydrogenase (short-subunit alcohol dehydrogenase family) [Micromonospora sp. Llam0]|uniref:oxidoreductase n=1 Tax=Micromonospora sp. Llam0 TaxID=2485143 RepID=UPI000F49CD19|nr:oxidoreductase [Micromonospora sp. Llam0]ROO62394.1 NAD(P)-dependent dehydrogenase (short-subunit alcohol dehydrogenase family) [Micromonospora sp. Llam0]
MAEWSFDDIPDQTGRVAVVTGANTGIGFDTARMLAAKGAHVVLTYRDKGKGEAALDRIRAGQPPGTVTGAELDLADLDSVTAFADAYRAAHDRLDLLINNAGVMAPPLERTRQGFELQIGTNHLGHFALTGELLPLLDAAPAARVVTVSSLAHWTGGIDLDDLNWRQRRYRPWAAYGQSKLANLLFTLELQRRLTEAGSTVRAVAAHPGLTSTEIGRHQGRSTGENRSRIDRMIRMQPSAGALPSLRAATDPQAVAGSYWGPARRIGTSGPPASARSSARAKDTVMASRLWSESEQLTGVSYPFATLRRAEGPA